MYDVLIRDATIVDGSLGTPSILGVAHVSRRAVSPFEATYLSLAAERPAKAGCRAHGAEQTEESV